MKVNHAWKRSQPSGRGSGDEEDNVVAVHAFDHLGLVGHTRHAESHGAGEACSIAVNPISCPAMMQGVHMRVCSFFISVEE